MLHIFILVVFIFIFLFLFIALIVVIVVAPTMLRWLVFVAPAATAASPRLSWRAAVIICSRVVPVCRAVVKDWLLGTPVPFVVCRFFIRQVCGSRMEVLFVLGIIKPGGLIGSHSAPSSDLP